MFDKHIGDKKLMKNCEHCQRKFVSIATKGTGGKLMDWGMDKGSARPAQSYEESERSLSDDCKWNQGMKIVRIKLTCSFDVGKLMNPWEINY